MAQPRRHRRAQFAGARATTFAVPLEIGVLLEQAADILTAPSSTISQLVDEAVANAVRHGRARHVDVMVRVAGDAVEVVVADDGVGVADDAQPGLGSSWRDQVSTWELVNADRGARLTARIPISGG